MRNLMVSLFIFSLLLYSCGSPADDKTSSGSSNKQESISDGTFEEVLSSESAAIKSAPVIKYANDLLTVKVQDISLTELLKEIVRQSGLSVEMYASFHDKITIQFDKLPLKEGMRRILRNHSFLLSYAKQTSGESQSNVTPSLKVSIFPESDNVYPIKSKVVNNNTSLDSLKDKAAYKDIQSIQVSLMSEDSSEREEAAEALGENQHPEAIELLSLVLEDEDEDVREAAVDALGEIGGDEAAQTLVFALSDEDSWVREAAVWALADIGGDEAAQALAVALHDEDSWVREEAVEALGEIGGETAISILEQALLDEDESVREKAIEILAELRE